MPVYDVVVVGGGHNGLIASIVLAVHGLRVAVLEQRYVTGGLASSTRRYGVWRSDYAYTIGLMPGELAEWLGVGEALETPDPSWVDVYEGEVWLRWWSSRDKLHRELESLGGRGAVELLSDIEEYWRCMRRSGFYYTPEPPSRDDVASMLERCRRGLEVFAEKTSREVLASYVPEDLWLEFIYPVLLDSNAFTLAYFNQSLGVWRAPKRALSLFNSILAQRAREAGVDLYLGARVERIIVRKGVATAVEAGGRVFEARRGILYAASIVELPRLLDEPEHLGKEAISLLGSIRETKHYVTRIDVYLSKKPSPPREQGWRGTPLYSVWGRVGGGEATYPTLDENTRIHLVQFSGVVLTENPDDVLELLPGVDPEAVVDIEVRGWWSQERTCNNPTGDPNHIPMTDPFLYNNRPLPGWGSYRTPVENLYHGSASSYPGGQVTGVPGVNAALRILVDNHVKPRLPFLDRYGGGRWG